MVDGTDVFPCCTGRIRLGGMAFNLCTLVLLLFIGSIVADICPQNFTAKTPMPCKKCSGALQMEFGPSFQFFDFYSGTDTVMDINCTVNKPANVSIFLRSDHMPYNDKRKEITAGDRVLGVKVHGSGCTHTVVFSYSDVSECQFGTFTCVAVTDQNETVSKIAEVVIRNSSPPLIFNLEDSRLNKAKELIIGSKATFVCSYKSRRWGQAFRPFITFHSVNQNGRYGIIMECCKKPKRYEWESKVTVTQYLYGLQIGSKKLLIRRVNESDARTYFCEVLRVNRCRITQALTLKTRPCKAGHYCSVDSSEELPCRKGTYSNITGLFNQSGCHLCPVNSYCGSGAVEPSPCPMKQFLPSKSTLIKVFDGKQTASDCQICPVDPCDKDGEKCSFICSEKKLVGKIGQRVRLKCALSNSSLLQNLTWYKGSQPIASDSMYTVLQGEKFLSLIIHKLLDSDADNYSCSGYEMIMGNHVKSSINLATTSQDDTDVILPLLLSLSGVVMCGLIAALIWWRRWSQSRLQRRIQEEYITFGTPSGVSPFFPDTHRVFGSTPSEQSEHKYDVFICYSNADKDWVRHTLLPKLKSYELRVCIDFQDFCPGSFIIENIADSISTSRKTIAVLSPDFVNSGWCKKELMMALTRIENSHQVIPVLFRECECPWFIGKRTYLDWCNEDVRETFWEQLLRTINDGRESEPIAQSNDSESGATGFTEI